MISGDKVLLLEKTLDEARRDYRWQKDAELMALSGYPPLRQSFPQYLYDSMTGYKKQPLREIFTIKTTCGHEHIGNCSIYDIDQSKSEAQIGILIGERHYWDMGYGGDAINTLVRYIFKDLGLRRIYLRTREDNLRARHCFEKCGFKQYGMRRQEGFNFILMELLH